MQNYLFKNINIIGLGLIGGSIAKACKKYGVGEKISAFDIDQSQIKFAIENKIIDGVYNFERSDNSDLIVICTPLSRYKEIFSQIGLTLVDQEAILDKNLKKISNKPTIIDVGSVKEFTNTISRAILKENAPNFIPCHPIAGSEKSGVIYSDADLFKGKKTIITPHEDIIYNSEKIENVKLFWERIGSNVELMPFGKFIDQKNHDIVYGLVSHLPQFLSFVARENYSDNFTSDNEILKKHFRLQNSNQKIWQEIFKENEENIKSCLELFLKNLDSVISALEQERYKALSQILDCGTSFGIRKIPNNELDFIDNSLNKIVINRIILTACFLNISALRSFQEYAGTGFRDFASIMEYYDVLIEGPQILKDNKDSIIKFLKETKDKIKHYEFI